MTFRPSLAQVSRIRRLLTDFCSRVLEDQETAGKIGLAAHELMENAIVYAAGGEVTMHLTIRGSSDGATVEIQTHNAARPEDIEVLRTSLRAIAGSEDSAAHYQEVIRATASSAGSGLGLLRVRAEADMDLRAEYAAGGGVTLTASARVC